MQRRDFIRRAAVTTGVVALGGEFWHEQFALASVVSGAGPYGPLQPPDGNGVQVPAGFTCRVIATTGQPVAPSTYVWHAAPDGGSCFPTDDGGWVYASNSEVALGGGGVGVLRFDAAGATVAAFRILSGTHRNCAGGATPWGTWLSCEENGSVGTVYECTPFAPGQGVQRPALGAFNHEAAGVDPLTGFVYLTEDHPSGRLYRFVPTVPGDLSNGSLFAASVTGNTVSWVPTTTTGPDRQPTTTVFNGGEGIWVHGGRLFFTTKGDGRVWELVLATQTLTVLYDDSTTVGAPLTGVDNITVHQHSGDLYVAEDGGNMEICVIGVTDGARQVTPFLRVNGQATSELTGPAFSPDGTRLYFSSQRGTDGVTGITYEITGPFRTAAPNAGPIAAFTSTVTGLAATFDASASSDIDGTITGYQWNFGDGATATGVTAQHSYALAGTYTVTLTVTDDDNASTANTASVAVGAGTPITHAADDYTRTVTNGWGSADTGGAWTVSTATAFAVNTGTGAITGAPGSTRSAYLTTIATTDNDLVADAALSVAATGGGAYLSVIGRRVASTTDYRAKLRYTSNGQLTAQLVRVVAGVETALTTTVVPGLTLAAGDLVRYRLQITGTNATTLRLKVWRTGAAEPATWLSSITDATPALQVPGHLGIQLYTSSSWTGAAPIARIDNLRARSAAAPATNVGPTAAFTSTPTGLVVAFDASGSTDSDGTITTYAWNFGDGATGTGATPTHAYATAGTYVVTLTVSDDDGATAARSVPVSVTDAPGSNAGPTAAFTTTPAGLSVAFDATGSTDSDGTITTYAWNFGDGTTGAGVATTHVYLAAGTYTVALAVTDDDDATSTTSASITVNDVPTNAAPTAAFTAAPSGLTVAFDAATSTDSDGTVTGYAWSFGDGATGSGRSTSHTYPAAGTYTVGLTVTDDDGATGTTSRAVVVTSTPPTPVIAADTFTRTVTNGWGSADTGGAWTVSTATAFAVNTGTGAITGAAGSTRSAYLTAATATDVDLVVDVALGAAATGGGAYVSIIGRRVAGTTDYRAKLRYTSNGQITAQLVRVLSGVETALTTIVVPGLTLVAGDRIRYRLQITGTTATTLRLKVWRSGAAEPTTWLSSATDATPAALRSAGHPGVQLYTSSSWTGAAPIVRIDDLRVAPPA